MYVCMHCLSLVFSLSARPNPKRIFCHVVCQAVEMFCDVKKKSCVCTLYLHSGVNVCKSINN